MRSIQFQGAKAKSFTFLFDIRNKLISQSSQQNLGSLVYTSKWAKSIGMRTQLKYTAQKDKSPQLVIDNMAIQDLSEGLLGNRYQKRYCPKKRKSQTAKEEEEKREIAKKDDLQEMESPYWPSCNSRRHSRCCGRCQLPIYPERKNSYHFFFFYRFLYLSLSWW